MKTEEKNGNYNYEAKMKKDKNSLTQRLTESEQNRRGKNNKAFLLAHWDEIAEALAAGWNMRSVWGLLHSKGEFPGSYDTFVKLVRAEQAKLPNAPRSTKEGPPIIAEQPKATDSHKTRTQQSTDRFIFNPDANDKELI